MKTIFLLHIVKCLQIIFDTEKLSLKLITEVGMLKIAGSWINMVKTREQDLNHTIKNIHALSWVKLFLYSLVFWNINVLTW